MNSSEPGSQQLILVDDRDRVLGSMEREECHRGQGRLHRAFSVLLFDERGRVLLQQRSAAKTLWPGFWSNSCCGHPQVGEETHQAARRRLGEELGAGLGRDSSLAPTFRFEYQAEFGAAGSERELCSVFLGRAVGPVEADPEEVAEWSWTHPVELTRSIERDPTRFTPWFRVIWRVLGLSRSGLPPHPEPDPGHRRP